jgi:hypothetical protein
LGNYIRESKSTRIRWEAHVECLGEMRSFQNSLLENLKGRDALGRLRRVCKIIVKCILKEWAATVCTAQVRDLWLSLVPTAETVVLNTRRETSSPADPPSASQRFCCMEFVH